MNPSSNSDNGVNPNIMFNYVLSVLTTPSIHELSNIGLRLDSTFENIRNEIEFRMINYPVSQYDHIDMLEEKMYNMAVQESINSYKFSEKKPNQILNISKHKFNGSPNDICVICQSNYDTDDDISTLKCSHTFHFDCILECGKYKPECPICRETIPIINENEVSNP